MHVRSLVPFLALALFARAHSLVFSPPLLLPHCTLATRRAIKHSLSSLSLSLSALSLLLSPLLFLVLSESCGCVRVCHSHSLHSLFCLHHYHFLFCPSRVCVRHFSLLLFAQATLTLAPTLSLALWSLFSRPLSLSGSLSRLLSLSLLLSLLI